MIQFKRNIWKKTKEFKRNFKQCTFKVEYKDIKNFIEREREEAKCDE